MDNNHERPIVEKNQLPKKSSPYSEQEYIAISESPEFKALSKRKAAFIVPITITFLLLYFLLPILSSFTNVLDGKAIGEITWIWVYSFGLFIMVWVLTMIYVKKAASFDKDVEKINAKAKAGDYK